MEKEIYAGMFYSEETARCIKEKYPDWTISLLRGAGIRWQKMRCI